MLALALRPRPLLCTLSVLVAVVFPLVSLVDLVLSTVRAVRARRAFSSDRPTLVGSLTPHARARRFLAEAVAEASVASRDLSDSGSAFADKAIDQQGADEVRRATLSFFFHNSTDSQLHFN